MKPGEVQDKYVPTLTSKKEQEVCSIKIRKAVVDYKEFGKGPSIEKSPFQKEYETINSQMLGELEGKQAPFNKKVYTRVGKNYSASDNFSCFNRLGALGEPDTINLP
jgi:hypothetical protein